MKLSVNLSVGITKELNDRLKSLSERTGLALNKIARMAIEEVVSRIEKEGGIYLSIEEPPKPRATKPKKTA
jgi:predicted DNA-binding protein